jgi:hypothetical protein
MASELRRVALGLMALSMRLDAYAMQRGLTMDAAHPKDPDPKNWRTINGSKVHLTEGKIDGGAGGKFSGKSWTGKTKHEFTPKEKAAESSPMPNFKKLPESTQKKLEDVTVHALSGWKANGDESSKKASLEKANKLLKEFCIEHEITPSQKIEINELVKEFKADMISSSQFKEEVAKYAKCNVGHPEKAVAKPAAAPQPTVQTQIAAQPKPSAPSKGQLQTKGLSKTKLTKATTGISTPKGTLGLYAVEGYKGVIDPAFKNFEVQYGSAQTAKFTKEEHDAVYGYTDTWVHLRDYLCYGKVDGNGKHTKESLQEDVDQISAGLAKMEHPNMWVKRGGSLMDWATKDNLSGATFEDLQRMQKDGTVFTNASFLSTNPSERITYGSKSVVRHFFVPKKAKGGYIKSVSAHAEELEFLLDKGTKTRIMKIEQKGGEIITYEEVVLDD